MTTQISASSHRFCFLGSAHSNDRQSTSLLGNNVNQITSAVYGISSNVICYRHVYKILMCNAQQLKMFAMLTPNCLEEASNSYYKHK